MVNLILLTFGEYQMNMRHEDPTIGWTTAHHIQRTSERRSTEQSHSLARVGSKGTAWQGFLVIVECFEKSTNISTAHFTFFDIKTRDIIMSDRYSAKEADGYGLSNYWGQAIFETFNKYAAYVYRKNLKTYIKSRK